MTAPTWSFSSPLWRWRDGSWLFVTLPHEVTDEIDEIVGSHTGGFGSVKVEVTCGGSTWQTSVFPSAEEASFVLPVKKAVRTAEGVDEGDTLPLTLRLVDR